MYMDRKGYHQVMPHAALDGIEEVPLLNLTSGYVERAASLMPKQGSKAPWYLRQNYLLDLISSQFLPIEDPALQFSRS
jgi:hypothetical protein